PVWNDLRAVATELAGLAPELAATPVDLRLRIEYRDTGHSLDRGIEWTARPSGGSVVLLAANADRNPVHANFEFPDRIRRCRLLGKDQELRPGRGIVEDRFAPFEAKAYRLSY